MISTYVVFDRVGYPQKYLRNGPVHLQDLANLPTSASIELELTSANARSYGHVISVPQRDPLK